MAVPLEVLWEAVSTTDGLQHWWLGAWFRMAEEGRDESPPFAIELEPDGVFQHHWRSTVKAFEPARFIEFANEPWLGGGMRIEVSGGSTESVFTFMVFGEQPAGPAGGWHGGIDALEMYLTDAEFELSAPLDASGDPPPDSYLRRLIDFYATYLPERYAWQELVTDRAGKSED